MIKIVGDTHTHTSACQHAYSTILENIAYAKSIGHTFLALTDHAIDLAGSPHNWYFENLPRFIPHEVDGLVVLRGCEVNVHVDGTVDVESKTLKALDWVIASMHNTVMLPDMAKEQYTKIWIKIAENPDIDCIGHMGQEKFKPDYDIVLQAFAKYNKIVEINSSSHLSRPDSVDNCKEIIKLCQKYGVKIVLSSDAHFAYGIGNVGFASEMVEEMGYPVEDIMNADYNTFSKWIYEKKGLQLPIRG